MHVVWSWNREVLSIELQPEELRELLALEATWTCLVACRLPGFLEATMRRYRISAEDMAAFLGKRSFNRNAVWRLQVLKRLAQGDARAVELLGRLRRLEVRMGESLLGVYLRSRGAVPEPGAGRG